MDERAEVRRLAQRMYRGAARAARDNAPRGVSRSCGTVVSNDGARLTVEFGTSARPMRATVGMTTACAGAKAGDRVLVDTYGHVSYAVGVVAG